METRDLKALDNRIAEAYKITGLYEFIIDGVSIPLKVKVIQYHHRNFMGIANLEVKGKGCGSYYRSIQLCETEDDAIRDAVRGFFSFFSEDADVREVSDW